MRKILLILVFSLLALVPCYAQQGVRSQKFTIAGASSSINLVNTAIAWHQLSWSVSGTASACTVALDSSSDGTTWSAGGVITGQTCTSNGNSAVFNANVNYVRIDMTALTVTAGSSVTVTWDGYVSDPSGGGGGTVSSLTGTSPVVLTPNPITHTGSISCPTCVTGPGGSNTQLQYDNSGVFGGMSTSSFNGSQLIITSPGVSVIPLVLHGAGGTELASLLDINNNATDATNPSLGVVTVRGKGVGGIGASGTALLALDVDSDGESGPVGWVVGNAQQPNSFINAGILDSDTPLIQMHADSLGYGLAIGLNDGTAGSRIDASGGSLTISTDGNPITLSNQSEVDITSPLKFLGSTGSASIAVAGAAGTPCTIILPTTDPTAGQFLSSAAPSSGSCLTSWATPSGGGGGGPFPQTVSGTTTSGGIPYFSSTTVLSSSGLLASGQFVLGGGAGSAPTTSFSTVPVNKGGTGQTTAPNALISLFPVATRAGDVIYWDGSVWNHLAGNNSGTLYLQETSSGVPSWTTPSGSISGLTTGMLPKAASATTITNSLCDEGITTANTFTCTDTAGAAFAGKVAVAADGTHPGNVSLVGNTTVVTPASNTFNLMGPSSTTFTAYALQFSGTGPAAAGVMLAGSPSSAVSQITYGQVPISLVGTAGLSATSPLAIASSGAMTCTTCTITVANGTSALGTGAITSGACATVVTTTATGTATTDNIEADFNADPTSTTGYQASANGMLTIIKYPTSGNVNFKVCNNTSSSITPGAVTLNWRVVR